MSSPKVRFKRFNVKALITQVEGPEGPYPVYRMGSTNKFERPEVPGQTYRRYKDLP